MIPITQTKVVVRNSKGEMIVHGNCYAACIASILEKPIEEIPNVEVLFHIDNSFWNIVMLTYLESVGWELVNDGRFKCFHQGIEANFGGQDYYQAQQEELKDKFYLVSGQSARGVMHMCIYKNGKLVHDPHPTKEGLITEDYFESISRK